MDDFLEFAAQFGTKKYKKGEIILRQEEVPTAAYIVKSGVIVTYNITNGGEERPISFDIRGEVFPAAWVFGKSLRTLFYYEALEDCELYAMPRDDFINFLKSNPAVAYDMFNQFVNYHISYQLRVDALEQPRASSKILHTLRYLCIRFGEDVSTDRVRIRLSLTQQVLGNFMGLTRETTSLELTKLQKQKVIKTVKKHYIIDSNLLNQLIDDEYDPGFTKDFQRVNQKPLAK